MKYLTPQLRSLSAGVVMLLFALGVVTFGVMSWTDVRAAVEDTKHNLGSTNTTGTNSFSGTADVCVFCHTPHGGSLAASVPLWNRTLSAPASYTTYADLNSATIDGQIAPVGSVSLACLSCHDGTQAMNVVINDPNDLNGGVWTGSNVNVGTGQLINGPNLGTDISNDHPIGVQYGGGGLTAAAATGTLVDSEFIQPDATLINGANVFWLDTEPVANGNRDKTDMILYNRNEFGALQPFVECASCHDPHTTNATFLRTSNDNSAVCLACHNK